MVRRSTARENWGEKASLRKCIRPQNGDLALRAMMSCARACPFKSVGGSFETILGTSLQARRCDCSFVLVVPMQTREGISDRRSSSAGKWERVSASKPKASFPHYLDGDRLRDRSILFSARQHRPCDSRQLVRHGHHNNVLGSSGVERVKPCADRRSIALDTQHGSSCTMNQDFAQVDVATLADAEQFCLAS